MTTRTCGIDLICSISLNIERKGVLLEDNDKERASI